MTATRRKWLRRGLVAVAVLVVLYFPARALLTHYLGVSELTVIEGLILRRMGFDAADEPVVVGPDASPAPTSLQVDEDIVPFREIGARLGSRATGNNMINFRGAAIFDANGDGRLDIYFPHSGRPVAKPTDEANVLDLENPADAKPCTLFINRGNDSSGDPIFESLQDLTTGGNDLYVREELLIENKYQPRRAAADDEHGPGRAAVGAVAADFDGDGRTDLYVLNNHAGLAFQTHDLGVRVYPARSQLGRDAVRDYLVIRVPSFLWGDRTDGLHETVSFAELAEAEGRNSLFLNLGDADGDGLPEWRDATAAAQVGGKWASTAATVADIDRDGDLDLYVANFLDPDFWGFGAEHFAGNRNQLYLNQLAETGELTFKDVALDYGVAGLHAEENLPSHVYGEATGAIRRSRSIVEGRPVGEEADHSWAALLVDWNLDGFPDLAVANDISNRLRMYENTSGTGFKRLTQFDDERWDGCWMGVSAGDLDGDGDEEFFGANCGGQVMSVRNTALLIEDRSEANLMALSVLNYAAGRATLHNAVLERAEDGRFEDLSPTLRVHHSPHIPPDLINPKNFAPSYRDAYDRLGFATGLTAYEFAWCAAMLDIDNDQDLDLYWAGALARGNDGFIGDWTGGPGRLMINETTGGDLAFRDRTLEYRLLDVAHIDYDANPPRRRAPGTGWHKRDTIYFTDTDGYAGMGLDAAKSAIRDIFRMHEFGNAVLSADLNDDGFGDIVVTHGGGYDSVSPQAGNMKVDMGGVKVAVPAPNKLMHPPTGFEEGPTFVFINGGAPRGRVANWVKLRLQDHSNLNPGAVGARVLANGTILRRISIGGVAFGGVRQDLHIGLGPQSLSSLEIHWPSGSLEPQRISIDPPVSNLRLCIDRERGRVACSLAPHKPMAEAPR